ncbi:DUF6167 family protein [Nocardioides sp.]|uniref:DUF6167 family protein n=1 Tax=Nocardioides sp. TaxID=35761 RepID=UPI002F4170EA
MRRGLWFMAGAGAGVYAMVRARRVAEAFTADGLSDRWHALTLGARMLRDEVAQGQAEAETELRERFGLVPHGVPELVATGGLETLAERAPQPPEVAHHRRSDDEVGED